MIKDLIKKHEGLRLEPYMDTTGHLTIGYGFNLDNGITEEIADYLLEKTIKTAIDDCYILFPNYSRLDAVRRCVLIDMMFNLGRPRLSGFIKMRKAVEEQDFNLASEEMLNSLWAKQVKVRAETLAN